MSRQKKKRIRAMRKKIAQRAKRRYIFTPDPLFTVLLPGKPGVALFTVKFAGTCIEGKITLP